MRTIVLTDGQKFLLHKFTKGYSLVDTEAEASHYTAESVALTAMEKARTVLPEWATADIKLVAVESTDRHKIKRDPTRKAVGKGKGGDGCGKFRKDGHAGVSVFFDADTYNKLVAEAQRSDMSLAATIRTAVLQYLSKRDADDALEPPEFVVPASKETSDEAVG